MSTRTESGLRWEVRHRHQSICKSWRFQSLRPTRWPASFAAYDRKSLTVSFPPTLVETINRYCACRHTSQWFHFQAGWKRSGSNMTGISLLISQLLCCAKDECCCNVKTNFSHSRKWKVLASAKLLCTILLTKSPKLCLNYILVLRHVDGPQGPQHGN